ncbi:hydroxymethylglutaryl-CoA lyase [Jannaschia sp. LMIT008]|uniref:hydroxymethylglutaryl-CoA lyase n=1 Tax=Jannaschia maritima TaxID=3032585 RepID=UPI002810E87C|nr:hydroxymethylglutaryl-CoA lyase [Jannaschia sp. LMIT008]
MDVLISEVGPRDGLQMLGFALPLQVKEDWIAAEAAAGVREIEVGSFVDYRALPQMADTAALVAHGRTIPGLTVAVLVPNLRGARAALEAGAHKLSIPLSVSEVHSKRNVNRDHAQMLSEIKAIRAAVDAVPEADRPHFEVGLSTAFGCSIAGPVAERDVVRLAVAALEAGAAEVGLSDTTGMGDPATVRSRIRAVRAEVGDRLTGVHLHNTRGLGLANAFSALEEGIATLDASLGGLGGCPAAPGASGNIVTEDLAFMLEAMGHRTGVDLDRLMAVRDVIRPALGDEPLHGFTPDAGLPQRRVPAA